MRNLKVYKWVVSLPSGGSIYYQKQFLGKVPVNKFFFKRCKAIIMLCFIIVHLRAGKVFSCFYFLGKYKP